VKFSRVRAIAGMGRAQELVGLENKMKSKGLPGKDDLHEG